MYMYLHVCYGSMFVLIRILQNSLILIFLRLCKWIWDNGKQKFTSLTNIFKPKEKL